MTIVDARRLRRFTRDEYHRMADEGILGPDERVELIEGEIVTMSPMHSPHAACVSRLDYLFKSRFGNRVQVRVQLPITLGDDSEPHPDFALVQPRDDHYAESHPIPEDIVLLVEVMDSTRHSDRRRKLPLYARHRIDEVWLVDLVDRVVEVHRTPEGDGYADSTNLNSGELQSLRVPGVSLTLDEILR